jgi:DnaK suppressor protein
MESTLNAPTLVTLNTLEAALRARRAEVLGHVRSRLHACGDADTLALINHLDLSGERIGSDVQSETDIALLDHELLALREVDHALARLEAGMAGVCSVCEDPIPQQRLLVNPTATTCIACQQEIERHAGHAGHAVA